MSKDEDTSIQIPFLKTVIELMNKHWKLILADGALPTPTVSDELEILLNLMGLSRLIEYNMRVSYEKLNTKGKLGLPDPDNFNELIKNVEPYLTEKEKVKKLHCARRISNGLVHADFKKVYDETKAAYDIVEIEHEFESFDPPNILFTSSVTKDGLHLTIKDGKACGVDSKGKDVPTKTLIPDGTNEIDIDFVYLYQTGAFMFVFDALFQTYKDTAMFLEKLRQSNTISK